VNHVREGDRRKEHRTEATEVTEGREATEGLKELTVMCKVTKPWRIVSLLRFKTPHSAPLANAESFYQWPRRQEWHRKLRSRGCLKADLIGGATFKGRNDEGVAFVVDLSKQKRAEEALQKTQVSWHMWPA
jgi:hypothetical protein